MRAAIASLFELPYEDVPIFGGENENRQKDNGYAQDRDLRAWLYRRGLDMEYVYDPAAQMKAKGSARLPWGFCIGFGKSPRGDWLHAVACRARDDFPTEGPWAEIVHDPHPDHAGIDGPMDFICFRLLDPRNVKTYAEIAVG